MFFQNSRYAKLPVKAFTDPAGRTVAYVARRIIPAPDTPVASVRVQAGDRLDLIADRALGAPTQFWRIADANPSADHLALMRPVGRRLRLTQIKPE